ncbi:MAG: porphobilinogen synthase, partial [Alphaproteobacteria bacterium]
MKGALHAAFPQNRPRRLRQRDWIRRLVAETRLSADDLIWPVFVRDGENVEEPVAAMPGVS